MEVHVRRCEMFKVEVDTRTFKKLNEARRALEDEGFLFKRISSDAYWFVNGKTHAYIWLSNDGYRIDYVKGG